MAASRLPSQFHIERYFAKYEFTTDHLLCCSDMEPFTMKDIIDMADDECRAMWDNLSLGYTESEGHPKLRDEIARMYGTNREDVLVIVPQEGIFIAHHCMIDYIRRELGVENPHVVATFPAYQSLYENIKTIKCDLDYWQVKETEDGWKFSLDDLRATLKDATKMIIVNFPHNPTGALLSESDWRDLINLCSSRGILLFSDEMYRLTNSDGAKALDSACSIYDNAVTLSGMSKSFALPGLRLGWLCSKNAKLLSMMQSFKDYTTICGPAPCEILSIIGLRNKDRILARTMGILKENMELLNEFFRDFPDEFQWYAPKAGTTGLLRVKGWLLKLGDGGASGFCDALVKSRQVLLLPASTFDYTDSFVRISLARRGTADALKAFRLFLNEHRPKNFN